MKVLSGAFSGFVLTFILCAGTVILFDIFEKEIDFPTVAKMESNCSKYMNKNSCVTIFNAAKPLYIVGAMFGALLACGSSKN